MPTSPQHRRMQPMGKIGENMPSNGAFILSWSDLFLRKQDQCLLWDQTLNPKVWPHTPHDISASILQREVGASN